MLLYCLPLKRTGSKTTILKQGAIMPHPKDAKASSCTMKKVTRSNAVKNSRLNGHARKKKPSVITPAVPDPLAEQRDLEGGFFKDEAAFKAWAGNAIDGAYPRCLYVGTTLYEIFEVNGQVPFTKEEVESLVIPEGPKMACEFTKNEFQPVSYVYACARDLAAQLASGKTIETAYHPRGGAFYSEDKGQSSIAVSGSVLKRERDGSYQFANGSALYRLAKEFGKKAKGPIWGWTLDRIQGRLERLQEFHQQGDSMAEFVSKAFETGGEQYQGRARHSGGGNKRTKNWADKTHHELRKNLEAQAQG